MYILISIFRWVPGKPVADRLMEIWSYFVKVVEIWEKLPKSKRPVFKSYLPVVEAVQDPSAVAKLKFFSSFCKSVSAFSCCLSNGQPNGTVFVSRSFQTHLQDFATYC